MSTQTKDRVAVAKQYVEKKYGEYLIKEYNDRSNWEKLKYKMDFL